MEAIVLAWLGGWKRKRSILENEGTLATEEEAQDIPWKEAMNMKKWVGCTKMQA